MRGAAFSAAVALGHLTWDDIPSRVRFTATFEPNPDNQKLYSEIFTEFVNIYKNNKRAFARLNGSRTANQPARELSQEKVSEIARRRGIGFHMQSLDQFGTALRFLTPPRGRTTPLFTGNDKAG